MLDFTTSPSFLGGGCSNTVDEVMARNVPCVEARTGDQAWLECDNGKVVSPCDVATLVCAWPEILGVPAATRLVLGAAAWQRIVKCFSTEWAAQQYSEIYEASREGMQ